MVTYSTVLGKRDPDKLKLTLDEAADMWAAGFRFSIYNPENHEFRLSAPYRLLQNLERGTITLQQP